jgi:hypothetical protein
MAETPMSNSSRPFAGCPSLSRRLMVTLLVAIYAAAASWGGHDRNGGPRSDWDEIWVTSHAWLHGADPYVAGDSLRQAGWEYSLLYPATATVLTSPLAMLPIRAGQALWAAAGIGALVFALTARGWYGLLALLSAPVVDAFFLLHWSPLLTGATAVPWLGLVWAAKPTIGLALLLGWPTRQAVIGCAFLVLVSLVLVPGWPGEWLSHIQGLSHIVAPWKRPGGFLLLLAFARWRKPEARMLGTLALVPHTTALYEMTPLFLIPRTAREMVGLVLLSLVAGGLMLFYLWGDPHHDLAGTLARQWPVDLALLYLPSLWLVLRTRD